MSKESECQEGGEHIHGPQREEHICFGSIHCSEQTCFGEINALVVRCTKCGKLLEDYDYARGVEAGKRMQ